MVRSLHSGNQSQLQTTSRHVPELDGVRGIAILLVLLFHFQGQRPSIIPRIFGAPFSLGWSGVDLFFVLSGFLITGILLDTRDSLNYLSSFYVRRMLRIFPLYLFTIFVYFEIALPYAHHIGHWHAETESQQIWFWLHLSNWRSGFGHDVPLLSHMWSLSIEEQFYLIWPMVVLLVRPARLAYVCIGMMATALFLRCLFLHSSLGFDFIYRLTPFRMDALAMGCLVAVLIRNGQWRAIIERRFGMIAIVAVSLLVVMLFFSSRTSSTSGPVATTFGYTVIAFAYGCLVLFAYRSSGLRTWPARAFRSTFLRAFGKYSYAIYIIHVPIAIYETRYVAKLSGHLSPGAQVAFWVLSIVAGAAVSFALALASWHLLEKHFLQVKDLFAAQSPRLSRTTPLMNYLQQRG